MNVGDLVRVKQPPAKVPLTRVTINVGEMGLITDVLEDIDGFHNFEVVFKNDRGWYSDLELEVINEAR